MAQLSVGMYTVDDDPNRIDIGAIHNYLSTESYWAEGRSRETVISAIAASARVVGAYLGDQMVGFCRVVTDGVAVAYLADVFVLEDHRGQGLATEMTRMAIDDGPYSGVRWLLHTRDAHELYRRFRFDDPSDWVMERPS